MSASWGFETKQIHVGGDPDPATGARAVPIYQTTSYEFRNSEHAANLFGLAEVGFIYTRIMNPTQAALEARVNALEGGCTTAIGIPGTLAVASGQAAETLAITTIAEAGSHVVASPSLYGGTYNLLHYTMPKQGVEVTFVNDPHNLEEWRSAIRPNTRVFFGESLANPKNDVFDVEGVSKVAHDHGITSSSTTPSPVRTCSARSSGVPTSSSTRSPSSSAATGPRSAVPSSTAASSTSAQVVATRTSPSPIRRTTALRTGRHSAQEASCSRPACRVCATPAQQSRRSTPSSSCRDSRR